MLESKTQLMDFFKKLTQEKSLKTEMQFYKELNETMLWVPDVSSGHGNNKKTFALLMTADGRKLIPAFLHKKSNLGRFKEEQLIQIPYNKLKYIIIDAEPEINGIAIAPYEENIVLDKNLMDMIDSQATGMNVRREEYTGQMSLRMPDSIPSGMTSALKRFFERSLEVEAAWLMKVMGENAYGEHWMLLIDFYGEKKELFPRVADIMKGYMKQGEMFELVQKTKDLIVKEIEPARIYNRVSNKNLF